MPPESALVKAEMEKRGVEVVLRSSEEMQGLWGAVKRSELVVGDFDWTRQALGKLGVPMPTPPDYPDCLQHLLHRRVWRATLGEVAAQLLGGGEGAPKRLFVKPAEDTKAFSGLVASADEWIQYLLEQFPPSFPLMCSELVEIAAEYRVYCVNGAVRQVCQYVGPKELALDMAVVGEAVRLLFSSDSDHQLAGCGIDFALIHPAGSDQLVTALVEVNDGYSLGAYDGLSQKDYTDMLAARWQQLVNP